METHQLETEWVIKQFFSSWLYIFSLSSSMILAPDGQVRMFGDIQMPKVMNVSACIYVLHQRWERLAIPGFTLVLFKTFNSGIKYRYSVEGHNPMSLVFTYI